MASASDKVQLQELDTINSVDDTYILHIKAGTQDYNTSVGSLSAKIKESLDGTSIDDGEVNKDHLPNHNDLNGVSEADSSEPMGHVSPNAQTFGGVKTFSEIPRVTRTRFAITDANDITSKEYVDYATTNIAGSSIKSGTISKDYLPNHNSLNGVFGAGLTQENGHINTTFQNFGGIKTFIDTPRCGNTPLLSNDLTNKSYVDAEVGDANNISTGVVAKERLPDHNDIDGVGLASSSQSYGHISPYAQTIYGTKTFDIAPRTSATPTLSSSLANKQYVDGKVSLRKDSGDTYISGTGGFAYVMDTHAYGNAVLRLYNNSSVNESPSVRLYAEDADGKQAGFYAYANSGNVYLYGKPLVRTYPSEILYGLVATPISSTKPTQCIQSERRGNMNPWTGGTVTFETELANTDYVVTTGTEYPTTNAGGGDVRIYGKTTTSFQFTNLSPNARSLHFIWIGDARQ